MCCPSLDDLAAEPVLGLLAALEVALVVLARTLRGADPDVDWVPRPGDDPPIAAARQLIDDCDLLLLSLDYYRDLLYHRLRRPLAQPDWPF